MTDLSVTATTHPGLVRSGNQDRVVVGPWILGPSGLGIVSYRLSASSGLVVVLDGMGGHAGGDIAASIAAEAYSSASMIITDAASAQATTEAANRAVHHRMALLPSLAGMGTTVVGARVVGDEILLFNIGDSRAYVLVDDYLLQATTDDAVGGRLTASLGGVVEQQPVRIHASTEPLEGRRFLLATDGLFGHLSVSDMQAAICDDDVATVGRLLNLAIDRGGPDNVSLALVRAVTTPTGEPGR